MRKKRAAVGLEAAAYTWAPVPRTLEVAGSCKGHGPKDWELEDN